MQNKTSLLKKRDILIKKISRFNNAISGNLTKFKSPIGSNKFFYRITWKENQKTKVIYVRSENVKKAKAGIIEFAKIKKILNKIGKINRALLNL